jgi:hypothetical protein
MYINVYLIKTYFIMFLESLILSHNRSFYITLGHSLFCMKTNAIISAKLQLIKNKESLICSWHDFSFDVFVV